MFKRSTGQSVRQYVIARRLERAKSLLSSKTLPLAEIALVVGFQDQSQFTAAFRNRVGTSREHMHVSLLARKARCSRRARGDAEVSNDEPSPVTEFGLAQIYAGEQDDDYSKLQQIPGSAIGIMTYMSQEQE
jgi:hypothetical protein